MCRPQIASLPSVRGPKSLPSHGASKCKNPCWSCRPRRKTLRCPSPAPSLPGALVRDVCKMFDPSQVASMSRRHKRDGSRQRQAIRRLVRGRAHGSPPVVGVRGSRDGGRSKTNQPAVVWILGEDIFQAAHPRVNISPEALRCC